MRFPPPPPHISSAEDCHSPSIMRSTKNKYGAMTSHMNAATHVQQFGEAFKINGKPAATVLQSSLSAFLPKKGGPDHGSVVAAVADFVVESNSPLHLVDQSSFRRLAGFFLQLDDKKTVRASDWHNHACDLIAFPSPGSIFAWLQPAQRHARARAAC